MFLNGSSEDLLCLFFYSITIIIIFNWLSYFFHICSVLLVSNKWIHERGQEFRRPCGLTEVDWSTPKGHTKNTLSHTRTYTTNSCALILEMMQLYNTYITVLSTNFSTWCCFVRKWWYCSVGSSGIIPCLFPEDTELSCTPCIPLPSPLN